MTFLVFDAPKLKLPYEERVDWLNQHIRKYNGSEYAAVVGVQRCRDRAHLDETMNTVCFSVSLMSSIKRHGVDHCERW